MPTATRFITRIQDCDDYADALTWASRQTFSAGVDVTGDSLRASGSIRLTADGYYFGHFGTETYPGYAFSGDVDTGMGHPATNELGLITAGSYRLRIDSSGNVGIGTVSPDRLLHAEVSDAATNAVTYAQRLSHITSGTAAANFGTGIEFELEDAGGGFDIAATIESIWTDASAGAEDGALVFKVAGHDTLREALRLEGDNTVAQVGFFGTAPQSQQAHIIDADGQLADITTKFNTLLADLEGYGLLKTS